MKRSSEALWRYFDSVRQMFRGEKACPWLKTQTHESLLPYLKEEVGEFIAALSKYRSSTPAQAPTAAQDLMGELGDLWLQSVLHLLLISESAGAPVADILDRWTQKVIDRHPHVFDPQASQRSWTREEVLEEWKKRKKFEKDLASKNDRPATKTEGFLEYSASLSELVRAHKIGERSRHHHFDWSNPSEVLDKVFEEFQELKTEIQAPIPSHQALSEELGDLLFSVVQLARHLNISSEEALAQANDKFIARFAQVEKQLSQEDPTAAAQSWTLIPRDRLEEHWKKAKNALKAGVTKAIKT